MGSKKGLEGTSEEYQGDFLYDKVYEAINSVVVSRLQECAYYQKWQKAMEEILEEHPFFESIIMGEGAVSLTAEEHKEFVRYMAVQDAMETARRREWFYVGQLHGKILQKDLMGRMRGTRDNDGGRNGSVSENAWKEIGAGLLEDLMQMVEEERKENLEEYPEYQKLELQEQELLIMNPFIPKIIRGDKMSRKMQPTRMQWHGLIDFLAVNHKKRVYEEMQTLIIGYKACIGYLTMMQ